MPKLLFIMTIYTAYTAIGLAFSARAELGSDVPRDAKLLEQRADEGGVSGSGIFDIAIPPDGTVLRPVTRVQREKFGVVGPLPLQLRDLRALIYPDTAEGEREAVLEGLTFFTTPHSAKEGLGPINNQAFCLGCHLNTAEAVRSAGLLSPKSCISGSTCVSQVARAGRSTPTNFEFTSLDPATGGGRAADNLDALNDTGRTAAFTLFGDFDPSHADAPGNPTGIGFFDPLDGTTTNIVTGEGSQPFGGQVQHTRPAEEACVPKPIPPVEFDVNLSGAVDPKTGLHPSGFRRSVGERAGPSYIGRGLMEAVPTDDILANADPDDTQGHKSSLRDFAKSLGCNKDGDCVSGRANMIPRTLAVNRDSAGNLTSVTGFVGGVGRFGLRANGVEILQFVIGGLQGELSFTSLINDNEINFPTLFPNSGETVEPPECVNARSTEPEVPLSTPFSVRNLLRSTAPPEFGDALLDVLRSPNPAKDKQEDRKEAKVRRGAELFGIDLKAFANRMIPGRMPTGGDGLDPNAINQHDRKLNCVGCHTPIQRTGQSPADVGAEQLSFVWAPIFSDLLLHQMPVIDAERIAERPRDPLIISRLSAKSTHRGEDATKGEG